MRELLARVRSLWRGLRRPERLEAEMEEEMRLHMQLHAERLVRERGLDAAEARRQAAVAFGGVERYKEEVRDVRGLSAVRGLSLDLRLGLRMLRKYPGLAVVGVLGMAVAIAIGAGVFSVLSTIADPVLPLPEGERVVSIVNMDVARDDQARESQLHDLEIWREELRAVEEIGAYRAIDRNLVTPDGQAEPLRIAEMTATGFQVARTAPLLGRYLVEEDEREGAPPVVVIGHGVWQRRFAGDPRVIGQTVRLGGQQHTIVGVMPEGFAFPVNNRVWAPLRLDPADYQRGSAPPIDVFARLAPGATLQQARAQLSTVGQRITAAHPETREHIRPVLLPYARSFFDAPAPAWILWSSIVSMLLVVIAVNVAILVYARTATRAGEIAVRLALGASRARVVTQLFAEALVLSALAAAMGLLAARFALEQVNAYIAREGGEQVPFWWNFGLSPATAAYAAGMAVLAAIIVGVVPGLKATGSRVQSRLRELGGSTGLRMGRTWTVLIVAQVAITVAILPAAVALAWKELFPPASGPVTVVAAEDLVSAQIGMDREVPPSADAEAYDRELAARLADRQSALLARLQAEPGVTEVTFASGVPGSEHPAILEVEDPRSGAEPARHDARFLQVAPDLFEMFGATILAGRAFQPADLAEQATAVVANRSFVQHVLGGGPALGRRFRYVRTDNDVAPGGVQRGGWYEIVGVVSDFAAEEVTPGPDIATLYHPAAPGRLGTVHLVARAPGVDAGTLAGRVREIATALDPALRVEGVRSLEQIRREDQKNRRLVLLGIAAVMLSVLLLSAAGVHALMSFTVARRRKEIGIRTALGAQPHRILTGVFSQALRQLGMGVAAGGLLAGALILQGTSTAGQAATLVLLVAALLLTVGVLAALGPARQGLRIQPMEALREE